MATMPRLDLGSVLRLTCVVFALGAIIALCVWLSVPKSLTLLVRDADEIQRAADFEVQFSGLDPAVKSIPIRLFYFPKTPIMGVTEHYWSIIAPASIDTISRTVNVPVVHGHSPGRRRWRYTVSPTIGLPERPSALTTRRIGSRFERRMTT